MPVSVPTNYQPSLPLFVLLPLHFWTRLFLCLQALRGELGRIRDWLATLVSIALWEPALAYSKGLVFAFSLFLLSNSLLTKSLMFFFTANSVEYIAGIQRHTFNSE